MTGPDKRRKSLSQQRGDVRTFGDKALATQLGKALRVPRDADPRVGTHGFHPWPGRMHPHTARSLVQLVPQGERIADPFMGGGTVIVEALLHGRIGAGSDLNPVAIEVAWARTRRWTKRVTAELLEATAACIRSSRTYRGENKRVPAHFFETEGEWYDPPALVEVWGLREAIRGMREGDLRRMLRVCLSSILVKVSRQATDSITRIDREHQWIPVGRVEDLFLRRVKEHALNIQGLTKAARSGFEPMLSAGDATRALPQTDGLVSAVISSPPYPGTYDYVEHHRRRYTALGFDASFAEEREIGSRRQQKETGESRSTLAYALGLAHGLDAWKDAMTPDGRVYFMIGDGQSKHALVPVDPIMREAAQRSGWVVEAMASQPREIRGAVGRGSRGRKMEHIYALARKK